MNKKIKRIIRVKDRVTTLDQKNKVGGLRGEVIFGKGLHKIEYTDPYGKKSFRMEFDKVEEKIPNIVPIGGYQFAFSKMFNIGLDQETTLRVGDLNDEAPQMKIGVQRAEYKSIYYDAECSISNGAMIINPGVNISAMDYIFGFMVGDGGAREDNMTAIAPNYKNRTLYRAIPFRMSNDGTEIPAGKYYGKQSSFQGSGMSEAIDSYYVKKFDEPAPHIVHVWVSDNPNEMSIVDDTVFASTSSMAIESYVEMNMSVSEDDVRGFSTSTNSSPRVNEFALVHGWYNSEINDYEHLQIMTHFTRPSIALAEGDSIEAIYRLYAR